MEKTYLAQKEKAIIEAANEVINFNVEEFVGDNASFASKFFEAKNKVDQKMDVLNDYYKIWSAIKTIKYTSKESNQVIDKQVYSLITKTYQELAKLTEKFNLIKTKFEEFSQKE